MRSATSPSIPIPPESEEELRKMTAEWIEKTQDRFPFPYSNENEHVVDERHPNVRYDRGRSDAARCAWLNRPGFAHTPHHDQLARDGVNFSRAYSACPSCIAARASLFTGLRHENHGFTGYDAKPEWHYPVTLPPSVLAEAGYHTQCVRQDARRTGPRADGVFTT
jgi:hypothetical protein